MDPMTLMSMFQGGGGQGGQGFGGFGGQNNSMSGMSGFLGNLFTDRSAPFSDAMKQYEKYGAKGEGVQNPFLNAGTGAIPQFQQWLQGMQDPSGFINNLMGKYQESPWAKYQQEQALRASGNMGSASGLTGSTPMSQFNQQNAHDISQQDMGDWLSRVLGINTQYGAGQQGLIQGGQNAANSLTNMYGDMGRNMAEAAAGKRAAQNERTGGIIGGGLKMLTRGLFG